MVTGMAAAISGHESADGGSQRVMRRCDQVELLLRVDGSSTVQPYCMDRVAVDAPVWSMASKLRQELRLYIENDGVRRFKVERARSGAAFCCGPRPWNSVYYYYISNSTNSTQLVL